MAENSRDGCGLRDGCYCGKPVDVWGANLDELIDRLLVTLQRRDQPVSAAADGRAIIAQQPDLYRRYASMFHQVDFDSNGGAGTIGSTEFVFQLLDAAPAFLADNLPTLTQVGPQNVVTSLLPILADEDVEALATFVRTIGKASSRRSDDALLFPYIAIAALYAEAPELNRKIGQGREPTGIDAALLRVASSRYEAARILERRMPAILSDFKTDTEGVRKSVSKIIQDSFGSADEIKALLDPLAKAIGQADAMVKQLHMDSAAAYGEIAELRKTVSANLDELSKRTSTSEENLEAFRTAVHLDERLNLSSDHWSGRAWWSSVAFACSLALLITIFIGAPLWAIFKSSEIQLFFANFATASYKELCPNLLPGSKCEPQAAQLAIVSLNRLVAVAFPLLLFFWLIKLLVRYNLHALVMGNDARQRSTMIKTFLYLADKDVVKKEDKTELLAAIFRPPPGTSGDHVEIPDVIEVVNRIKG